MPWRSREAYNRAYELIDAASIFPWPADLSVMMDFEIAMRQAWTDLHQSHKVKGCLFHLTQCLWKKVSECGFSTLYNENTPRGIQARGDDDYDDNDDGLMVMVIIIF